MSEAVYTTHRVLIEVPRITCPVQLWPLGDQHIGAAGHDADRYRDVLREARRVKPYVLFMGDEHDYASESERAEIKKGKLHGTTRNMYDRDSLRRCREFIKQHEFLRGRILGFIQGNHHWEFLGDHEEEDIPQGMTSTQYLARELGSVWLGFLSYIRITLSESESKHHSSLGVDVVACHGKAGGKLVGTSINQVDDLKGIFPGADIYLMGHNHQRGGWPSSSLYVP